MAEKKIDHGDRCQVSRTWSEVWPNLLQFVGPRPIRESAKSHVEGALACWLTDQHYIAIRHFNFAIEKLEQFPPSATATPTNNTAEQETSTASAAATSPSQQENQQQEKEKVDDNDNDEEESIPEATEIGHRAALDFIYNSHEYNESVKKTKLADILLEESKIDNTTWKKVSVDKATGDGTYYREEEDGSGTHSFRIIGTMKDMPILDLACMILELDLFSEWFPFCCRSRQVGLVTRYERCATFEISLPWPLSNREAVLWGFAVDDLDRTRQVIIYAQNHLEPIMGNDGKPIDPPKCAKNIVRLDCKRTGYVLEAVSPTITKVSFVANIDPQMSIPNWLLNWANSKFCGVLIWQLERSAKKAKEDKKSPYSERKKHDIYSDFKARIQQVDYNVVFDPNSKHLYQHRRHHHQHSSHNDNNSQSAAAASASAVAVVEQHQNVVAVEGDNNNAHRQHHHNNRGHHAHDNQHNPHSSHSIHEAARKQNQHPQHHHDHVHHNFG